MPAVTLRLVSMPLNASVYEKSTAEVKVSPAVSDWPCDEAKNRSSSDCGALVHVSQHAGSYQPGHPRKPSETPPNSPAKSLK